MPDWFLPLLALIALVGFIGFAFRQGTKANPDNWQGGAGREGSQHHGFDGHS
jgi:hypothetical protein